MSAVVQDFMRLVPPQAIDAEQSVLGSILWENSALNNTIEILGVDDFYRETHREILRAMLVLSSRNEPIDAITLTNALKEQDAQTVSCRYSNTRKRRKV